MIERILEAPLKSCKRSENKELENKLLLIKDSLQEQATKQEELMNHEYEEEEEEVSEYGSEYESEDDSNDIKGKKQENDSDSK